MKPGIGIDRHRSLSACPLIVIAGVCLLSCLTAWQQAAAQIPADSRILEGNYIRTGVSNNGTLGVGGSTSPGFIFDSTGTGTFNPANDYLTPGIPHEGFSVRHDSSGIYLNNNTGTTAIGPTSAPVAIPSGTSGFDNSLRWSGNVAGEFTVSHDYGLNDDSQNVQITTTITALTDLTNVRFSRWIDPDSGGTSSINSRGNATLGLAPEDWVNSESETNGATLGLYSNDAATHNTGISPGWSTDPDTYVAGTGDTVGDHTIGIGFALGDLLSGESLSFVYFYAVSADVDDFDLGASYASRAVTFNQLSVAEFLDNLDSTPAGLSDVLSTISPLTDSEFQLALDQMGGAIYASLATVNLQHTSYYLGQMATRFRGQMMPHNPLSSSGYVIDEPTEPTIMLVSYQQPCDPPFASAPTSCLKRGGWITGYGLGGQAQHDGNADGLGYGLGGTQFAIERPLNRNWMTGMWGNLAWGTVKGQSLNELASIQNYHFGGHLVGFDGRDYFLGLAGAGANTADVRRTITAGGLNQTAVGQADGFQGNVYLERGRSLCWRGLCVQPFGALQYIFVQQDALIESGAGALNLAVGDLDAHSLRTILGARVATTYDLGAGRAITPELRGSWMHEMLDTQQLIGSQFTGTAGTFLVQGLDIGRDWATVGGGLNLHLGSSARLFAGYDVQFNDYHTWHVGSGGFETVW